MATQTTKVKNGTITLPKELRKTWDEKEIFIKTYRNKIIIERPKPKGRIFSKDIEQKLQTLGKKITQKDIDEAICWARRQAK